MLSARHRRRPDPRPHLRVRSSRQRSQIAASTVAALDHLCDFAARSTTSIPPSRTAPRRDRPVDGSTRPSQISQSTSAQRCDLCGVPVSSAGFCASTQPPRLLRAQRCAGRVLGDRGRRHDGVGANFGSGSSSEHPASRSTGNRERAARTARVRLTSPIIPRRRKRNAEFRPVEKPQPRAARRAARIIGIWKGSRAKEATLKPVLGSSWSRPPS